MATNTFFNFIEIKYTELTNQINTWLQGLYGKSGVNLGPASPFGQILEIQKELFQHNIIYLKNAANQINISESTNEKVIKNIAIIAGLNVSRAISATGTLKMKIKPGINIQDEIKDSTIIINDNSVIKNKTNNLNYSIKLGADKVSYNITPDSQFFLKIVQGKFETQKFTGNDMRNQSIRVNVPSSASIENFNYTVKYNGIVLGTKEHLWDMLIGEMSCYTKTGFNGGLDIWFGNENFGFIPSSGSIIEVTYLLSNGTNGNIMNPIINDWKMIDDITDSRGNTIKIDKLFDVSVETPINFSSDPETSDSIKATIPYVSRNFVLATPDQFIFHLRRLNMFSKVNAFNTLEDNDFSISDTAVEDSVKKLKSSVNSNESVANVNVKLDNFMNTYTKYKTTLNDNVIYLYLIPDIKKYFIDNINYFNIPLDSFYLSSDEETKIISYLRQIGTMSLTTNVKIVQPNITKYVTHIYVRRKSDALEENIKNEIITQISNYLLTNDRFDRLPRIDFTAIVKGIDGVDSASVNFVSKATEDYFRNNSGSTMNQKTLIGLDPVYGDIVIGKNEHAIIRGGFRDRNGVWYNENPTDVGLNSINIFFNGVTQV